MYDDSYEHLAAELRRLDLILLVHLHALRPVEEAAKAELAAVVAMLSAGEAVDTRETAEAALRSHVERIRGAVGESLTRGIHLPIVELCRALGLDGNSLGFLMLACAPHIDRRYAHVFSYLQGDRTRSLPRVDLALYLLGGSGESTLRLRRYFEPASPLLRSGHIRVGGDEADPGPALDRPLLASPRLVRQVMGIVEADPVVEAMAWRGSLVEPALSQRQALARFAQVWRDGERPGALATIVSEDTEGIVSAARALAEVRGVPFLAVDLARPLALQYAVDVRVREVFREAALLGALLCVVGHAQLAESERELVARELAAALEGFDGPCILVGELAGRVRREARRRPFVALSAALPDTEERAMLWSRALAEVEGAEAVDVDELAWRYRLGPAEIRDAVRVAAADVQSREGESAAFVMASLVRACRTGVRREIETLAQAIQPRGDWSDLVLPATNIDQLRELVRHLKHQDLVFRTWGLGTKVLHGEGIAALFSGPPGTGKTMASALIAGELGRELFRVELAGLVSKYIGETEKNLERVFAAAHRGNAVLFFDEADALFGKRSEVKDAHDRYANVETSYLLQRIENFDGVVILATNLKRNIDEAFLRRMAVVVEFPPPDVAQRRRLWTTLMPAMMPREDAIDVEFLAQQFELSGGHIKNAIQAAAMLAAEGRPQVVRFGHLLAGVRREMQKQGRVVDAADFGKYRGVLEGAAVPTKKSADVERDQVSPGNA